MGVYRVIGIESSPYAVKVRAVLRYRRIAHHWVARMPQFFAETAAVRPQIMPVVQYPDGSYRTDSTPIIVDLERAHPGARSVIPAEPGAAFLSDLVEDLADEWLTKSLFHYRFSQPADQLSGARWVMDDAHPQLDHEALAELTRDFIARQVSRMSLVGCTPANAPLLEASYRDVLQALEGFVATDRFLFGSRPALADFGLYAQLNTLAADPTPGAIMRERAPRTRNWVRRLDDTSGVEGEWRARADDLPPALCALLGLAGRRYLPYLAANQHALDTGVGEFAIELDGHAYSQPVFRYHARCYGYLRSRFGALPPASLEWLRPVLAQSGCLDYLEGPAAGG